MKRIIEYFTRIVLIISIFLSNFVMPLSVSAESIVQKGDIKLGDEISETGEVTVPAGSFAEIGDVEVTKTVRKTNVEGKYEVEFNVRGKSNDSSEDIIEPIYIVIVFDTSGSMICDGDQESYAYPNKGSAELAAGPLGSAVEYKVNKNRSVWCSQPYGTSNVVLKDKWENAVAGAISFSEDLTTIENTNVSLVTFASAASSATAWSNTKLSESDFGYPYGATNLEDGLATAKAKLTAAEEANAAENKNIQKYIVVIGDGGPTASLGNDYADHSQRAIDLANSMKSDTKIYTIGYGIDNDKNAQDVLKKVSSNTETDTSYYLTSGTSSMTDALDSVVGNIEKSILAGTKATLEDEVGENFNIIGQDGTTYKVEVGDITTEPKTYKFEIELNEKAKTGWHATNDGFTLTYTDSNGEEQKIESDNNPYVYWEYNYVVNYYKDSISEGNLVASDVRDVTTETEINIDNVQKDKYLNNLEKGTIGYEFSYIDPEKITLDTNREQKVINVVYTKQKFDYKINYYYDNTLDTSIDIKDAPYGTKVDSTSYYLEDSKIKEGYILDDIKSDSGEFVITDNSVVIDIYYKKNNYDYKIEYYFDNVKDSTFTQEKNSVYGTTIEASKNYLEDIDNERLLNKETTDAKDYFLDPTKEENVSSMTIGTGVNLLSIYYISTKIDTGNISKKANIDKITSSNTPVTYIVKYTSTVKNVKENDKVVVTIVDTLPAKIDESKSTLNGGKYNEKANTITWTFEETQESFTAIKEITKEISYTVVYKEVAGLSSSKENILVNSVTGTTKVNNKSKASDAGHDEVTVEIYGTLTVKYVDENGVELATGIEGKELVGTSYGTSAKDITGYELVSATGEEEGKYIEGQTDVIYTYTKKNYSYTVNYYYEGIEGIYKTETFDKIPYQTEIDAKDHYLESSEIKEGYLLDTINSDNNNYTITDNSVVIDIYYKKNNYDYKVEYYFDNVKDSTFTQEKDAVYGTTIEASKNYLEDIDNERLLNKETTDAKDYFLDPTKEENTNSMTIGTGTNLLNIYYISTQLEKGNIEKNANIETLSSSVTPVTYTVNYTSTVNNVRKGDKVVVTIVDILPAKIDESKSTLNGGKYNEKTNTITWTFEETQEEFESVKSINKEIEFTVVYESVANLSSKEENSLVNSVTGTTKVNDKSITSEAGENEITVEVYGTLTIKYIDEEGNILLPTETRRALVGTSYETLAKEITDYELLSIEGEEKGIFTEDDQTVTYVYTNSIGNDEGIIEPPHTGVEVSIEMSNPIVYMNATLVKDKKNKEEAC